MQGESAAKRPKSMRYSENVSSRPKPTPPSHTETAVFRWATDLLFALSEHAAPPKGAFRNELARGTSIRKPSPLDNLE
jgi:hypothetical protein